MRETNVKIIIAFLAICLVVGLVGYFRPKTVSNELVGKISNVTDKNMTVKGFYRIPANPGMEDKENSVEVNVKFNGGTKFVKTVLHYPSEEELKASGGRYEISKLRQEDVEGNAEDLKSGAVDGAFVFSNSNVFDREEFTASEVKYRMMVRPE